MRKTIVAACVLAVSALVAGCAPVVREPAANLRLPPGFSAEVLARVPGARSMALGSGGTLFVGTMREGSVYSIARPFGRQPEVRTILKDLKLPNGVAFRNGTLYVADQQRLLAIDDAEAVTGPVEPRVLANWPFKGFLHSWKYLAFGPDGLLYVTIGAPCNVCDEPDFGLILRMKEDGTAREVVARGVRNSVGLDWHPRTGELWFTDNGRDMLGDDLPPCELNRVTAADQHFGFPFCHAGTIQDPQFAALGRCESSVAPVRLLGPHVAPLGMRFYTGRMFPAGFRDQIFIAEHGSWNRSKAAGKTGYRVSIVRPSAGGEPTYEPFIEGFLDGDNVLGRPVDIIMAPDGALLVSDDTAGAIYRISYRGGR